MSIRQLEPMGQVRTKIVATLGPASSDPATIAALVEAGVDVFRLNFSHGTRDEHSATHHAIRAVERASGRSLAILQDLGGPKIRLGPIPGDEVECRLGDEFTLVTDRTSDDPRQFTCTYRELPRDLKLGDVVLFADGAVAMKVVEAVGGSARLVVTLDGRLRSRQGLNLPGVGLSIPTLTEKDLADLDWTAREGVEYVGLSFVRKADDISTLRAELESRGCKARIVAKIEKPEAVADLDGIIARTDAVMVARGDLGVEMDVAEVPAIQKRVIAACHRARIPVITATQMLNSMETSNRPTRAEASDVFNAVLDGTDAVMLSGETAIGRYPVEAVETMSRIVGRAESFLASKGPQSPVDLGLGWSNRGWITPITEAVVDAASLACRRLNAALLVVATRSGRTALAASKHRNATPTLALADDPETARAMALYWGVTPIHAPNIVDVEHAMTIAEDWARTHGIASAGSLMILVRGTIPGNPTHNAMLVKEVR
ncbi:pyruvate kinase [Tundrisphaera lichenicola]|uniref:pyruvate kinase n=1 Tax=Tundrisphaera lichenicola TaxID=2029860 RepID=UPI003EBBB85D